MSGCVCMCVCAQTYRDNYLLESKPILVSIFLMNSTNHQKGKTFSVSPARMALRLYSTNILSKYSLVLWNLSKTDGDLIHTALSYLQFEECYLDSLNPSVLICEIGIIISPLKCCCENLIA